MVSIRKVMERGYIVRVEDMYFDLYIEMNEDGLYECFFFDEYIECKTINEVKNQVKKFITNHGK